MKSRVGYLLASATLVFALFLVPASTSAITDTKLAKPILQRYDLRGESFVPPYTDEIVMNAGDKITLAGASEPGGRVTVLVGNKSIKTDGVANGTWATTIPAEDFTPGSDTIVAQTVVGDRTSELSNLLKIKVVSAESEKSEASNNWLVIGLGVLLLAVALFVFKKFKRFPAKTKKNKRK